MVPGSLDLRVCEAARRRRRELPAARPPPLSRHRAGRRRYPTHCRARSPRPHEPRNDVDLCARPTSQRQGCSRRDRTSPPRLTEPAPQGAIAQTASRHRLDRANHSDQAPPDVPRKLHELAFNRTPSSRTTRVGDVAAGCESRGRSLPRPASHAHCRDPKSAVQIRLRADRVGLCVVYESRHDPPARVIVAMPVAGLMASGCAGSGRPGPGLQSYSTCGAPGMHHLRGLSVAAFQTPSSRCRAGLAAVRVFARTGPLRSVRALLKP